jgi:serine/threonine-protein kinase
MLAEGSRFGGYVVGPCIGEGGMARVYRAQHEGLQRQVALKVLLDGHGKDGEGHERFLREARMIAAIKHPNVVNIFDVGVHQGRPYLVMELLEGMDLEAYVASQGPLEEPMLMDVIIPIVAGLAAVHDAGIVHRDLKPGNIFLARGRNDEMEPKLLDFGISKSSGPDKMRLTNSKGLLMGTPFYMSPEASQGLEMTGLSDQYALGVVLYEAATGTNPFSGASTFGEVVRQVTTGDYPPVATRNPKLSKRMIGIIERAMQLEPARRFPDMRAMGRELLGLAGQRTRITWGLSFSELSQGAGAGDGVGAPLPAVLPRRESQRPQPARKSRYVLPAALVALAGAAAFWMNWPKPEGQVALNEHSVSEDTHRLEPQGRSGEIGTAEAPAPAASEHPSEQVPAEEPVAERVAQGLSEPIAALHGESAQDPPAEPVAPKAEEKPAPSRKAMLALNPPPRTRSSRASSSRRSSGAARAVPTPVSAPASTNAAPGTDGTPEWVILSRGQNTQGHGPDRGTNNAPILD